MRNMIAVLMLLVSVSVVATGCEQFFARKLGGDISINLPCGKKLVNATWKENDVWYLLRSMRSD